MVKAPLIDRIDHTDRNLLVWMQNEDEPVSASWIWVRDHSRDESAFDLDTAQRKVDTFSISEELRAEHIELVDDTIIVDWCDDTPSSHLPAAVLVEALGLETGARALWNHSGEVGVESVPYEAVVESAEGLTAWLGDIERFGLAIASGVPTGREQARALAERVGYIRRTVFGDLWTLSTEVTAHADSAYGQATLEPHTDGTYSHDAPGLQQFVCQERTGEGGESVVVDGFAAAEALRKEQPEAFEILADVAVPAHYMEEGVHLRARRPTIRVDPRGRLEQISFNNYDRSPFVLPLDRQNDWYEAYAALHRLITDRDRWWARRLEPGDALIVDNWRCLHGRLGFTGTRVFEGCYLNHEDLESALRVAR